MNTLEIKMVNSYENFYIVQENFSQPYPLLSDHTNIGINSVHCYTRGIKYSYKMISTTFSLLQQNYSISVVLSINKSMYDCEVI